MFGHRNRLMAPPVGFSMCYPVLKLNLECENGGQAKCPGLHRLSFNRFYCFIPQKFPDSLSQFSQFHPVQKGFHSPIFMVEIFDFTFCLCQDVSKADASTAESMAENNTAVGSHLKMLVVLVMLMLLMLFAVHCTWVTSNAYSSPSIVLATTNYDG